MWWTGRIKQWENYIKTVFKYLYLSTPHPPVVQESALLILLPSHCGDAGQHDDAAHHSEIQRQLGRCQKCQSQSSSFHQGQEPQLLYSAEHRLLFSLHLCAIKSSHNNFSFSFCSGVSTWWTEALCSNRSTTTSTVLCPETQRYTDKNHTETTTTTHLTGTRVNWIVYFLLKYRRCLSSSLSSCVLSATMSTMSLWTCPCHLEKEGSWDFKVRGSKGEISCAARIHVQTMTMSQQITY